MHDDFPSQVLVDSPFAKTGLDRDYVERQQALVTRGWLRLREVVTEGLPIVDYPLPEVRARWQ